MKRNYFKLVGSGFLVFVSFLITSCEKDISENRDFDPSVSEEVVIKLNSSEIGGEDLVLVSARDENSPLVNDSFSTIVSKDGVQLLFVKDNESKVRALFLSIPDGLKKSATFNIGCLSTAVASIFISPGIMTLVPKDADQVVSNIQLLNSFHAFNTYLNQNLLTKTLNEIVIETQYCNLLDDCLNEYYNRHTAILSRLFPDQRKWKNDLYYETSSDNCKVTFHNQALRCVNVVERDLNLTRTVLDLDQKIYNMEGAPPFSWGSVLTLSYLLDHNTETIDYVPATGTYDTEFWVVGPGYKKSTLPVPESIIAIDIPWLESIGHYIVLPLIDLTLGTLCATKITGPELKLFWDGMRGGITFAELVEAETPFEIATKYLNTSKTILGILSKLPANQIPASVTAIISENKLISIQKAAGELFLLGSGILAVGNIYGLAINMEMVEPYTKFYLCAKPSEAVRLYSTTNSLNSNIANTLIKVDPYDGTAVVAGQTGQVVGQFSLDRDPITGLLFGVDPNNPGIITVIDIQNGLSTIASTIKGSGNLVKLFSIAFNPEGVLYGIDDRINLGRIDLENGTFQIIKKMSSNSVVGGIDFSPNGILYSIQRYTGGGQYLITINEDNGTITSSNLLSGSPMVGDIDVSSNGFIYGTNFSWALVRIDPSKYVVNLVGFNKLGALGGIASSQ